MSILKPIIIIFAVLVIASAALFYYADVIAVRVLERSYGLDISYENCSQKSLSGFIFNGLSVQSRKTGLGFRSGVAAIKPRFVSGEVAIGFDLTDVIFTRKKESAPGGYDTLTALVSAPFENKYTYKNIRGLIETAKGGVKVTGLEAVGSDIKLSLNGALSPRGTIDSDIVIYFAETLTNKMPPEIAGTLLTNAGSGWSRLSVHLSGDPAKPSIQVSSKSFRLSIKAVSGT